MRGKYFIRVGAVGIKSEKIRQYFLRLWAGGKIFFPHYPAHGKNLSPTQRTALHPHNRHQPLPSTRMGLLIHLAQQSRGDLGIDLGSSYIHVTEQLLHYPNVRSAL